MSTVGILAINLIARNSPVQLDVFGDYDIRMKRQLFDGCIDTIWGRFDRHAIVFTSLLDYLPITNDDRDKVRMPGIMYA